MNKLYAFNSLRRNGCHDGGPHSIVPRRWPPNRFVGRRDQVRWVRNVCRGACILRVLEWQPIPPMLQSIMKRLLHLILLIGAILGLVGQGAAVASSRPCPQMIALQAVKNEACAMRAMPKEHGVPMGKHVPLGCMTMASCIAPATIEPALFIAPGLSIEPVAIAWPAARSLSDRSIAPEQEPPASLL